ncbi:POP1-domain-containing protein [Auriscalpium vulgare]|uniref:POP1-domain-containing protein n=1 Tax=Auriscalpium vulgare TaxID=40419 RepID=A0ACB8S2Y2_9AGAM|nr:POP1-domain-containing protein [Auriscalpium vulgare]
MPPKRPIEAQGDVSGRQRKKQKMDGARTIAVQHASGSTVPAASTSNAVRFDSMKGLPGSIDVDKFAESRAFEIKAMQEAMKNARAGSTHRAWQELPRHLRRRAASHDVRRVPLRMREKSRSEMDPMRRKVLGRSLPKRGKMRREARGVTFLRRQENKKWLESHLWHAKRMKMENMWGYRLAVHPTEKSFRPSHRASVHGAILHDASYYGTVELKGLEHVLKAILGSCCDLQGQSPAAKRFLTGTRACETAVYGANAYPFDYVGPVTIIWQPLAATTSGPLPAKAAEEGLDKSVSKRKRKTSKKGKEPAVAVPPVPTTVDSSPRTVWVRAHPSIFAEVLSVFQLATSLALDSLRSLPEHADKTYEVHVTDLRDAFNIFEIMGPKASQVIKGALTPLHADINKRPEFKEFWSSLSDLQTSGSVPSNMIVGFTIMDPRLNFPPKNAKPHTGNDVFPSISAPQISLPTTALAQSALWDGDLRSRLKEPRFKKKEIDARKAQHDIPGAALKATPSDDRIPVLLIQRSLAQPASADPSLPSQPAQSPSPSIHGWTLLLPAGWSMPALTSLLYTGTRVGGQRERAHQALEAGVPCFPRDMPATPAYDTYARARAAADRATWAKKPPAKRVSWEKMGLGVGDPWRADWRGVLGLPAEHTDEEEDEGDAVPTQREDAAAQGKDTAVQPWLLRGPATRAILARAATLFNPAAGLHSELTTLRTARHIAPVARARVDADTLFRGALVQVRVVFGGRGCPTEGAVAYKVSDAEAAAWRRADEARRRIRGRAGEESDEAEISQGIPDAEEIVGYVTSGGFSLSRGRGHALGAVSIARYFELQTQAEKLRLGGILVKVRDRQGVVCRAAFVEVLETS